MGRKGVVYRSRARIRREQGPVRTARLPARDEPVVFGVHSAIAEHYGLDPSGVTPHPTTIDFVVAAAAG